MTTCPDEGVMVEQEIDRVLTQYRESPNLLGMLRIYLGQVEEAYRAICAIPSFFDIETAVGDQLTLIGKRLGFPRCHCVCVTQPVVGFACGGAYSGPYEVVGFCEGSTWLACGETGVSDICLDDDEVYRGFLLARRYQALGLFDIASLQAAAMHIWGGAAQVINLEAGRVCVVPGRPLTDDEILMRPIVFRALPIAPGIKSMTSNADGPIAGFGSGWIGFCADTGEPEAEWLCPVDPHPYSCP